MASAATISDLILRNLGLQGQGVSKDGRKHHVIYAKQRHVWINVINAAPQPDGSMASGRLQEGPAEQRLRLVERTSSMRNGVIYARGRHLCGKGHLWATETPPRKSFAVCVNAVARVPAP